MRHSSGDSRSSTGTPESELIESAVFPPVFQTGRPFQDARIHDIVHAPRWLFSTDTTTMLLTQTVVQARAGLPH